MNEVKGRWTNKDLNQQLLHLPLLLCLLDLEIETVMRKRWMNEWIEVWRGDEEEEEEEE
jgi:hypothetical protein